MTRADMKRELEKLDVTLIQVERHLTGHNQSMAALHTSETVLPSPLTAAVQAARLDVNRLIHSVEMEG